MIRIVWYTGIVLSTLVVLVLLWQFSIALALFILSLALAAAFRPVIDAWARRGLNRNLAMLLAYTLTIGLISGLLVAFSGPLITDIQNAANDSAASYEHIKSVWPEHGSLVQQSIAEQLPPPTKLYEALAGKQGMAALQAIFGVALNFFDLFGRIAIIIVLSMYWSADQVHFERLWLSLLSVENRSRARDIWRAIESEVGAYIRSQFTQSILSGITLGLGYWVIGLKYPALFALLAALARLIPWFGKIFILSIAFAVGAAISTGTGVLAVVYSFFILIALDLFIQPRFYSKKRYNSILILVILITMAYAYGLVGLLVAGPLAVVIQVSLLQLFRTPSSSAPQEITIAMSTIQERLKKAQTLLENAQDPNAFEINNLVKRVEGLVEKTGEQLNSNHNK
jgi:putative permease